jgi:hypothetical protein
MASRKRIWNRVAFSPLLYVAAILLGFIHVYIPIVIYIIMPVAFMFLPQMDFEDPE